MSIKFKFLCLVLGSSFVFGLGGCTTSSPTHMPDGSTGFAINCSGNANSIAGCYDKAAELCKGQGFTVVDRDGSTGYSVQKYGNSYSGVSYAKRTMMVKCGT